MAKARKKKATPGERIAKALFLYANIGPSADRLVMEFKGDPLKGPGWSEQAMAEFINKKLRAMKLLPKPARAKKRSK